MPQLSLPCPHCLSEKIGFAPRAVVRGSTDQQTLLFLQCEGCGGGLCAEIPTHPLNVHNWMQAGWVFPGISDTYPAIPQSYCPADVPDNVRNAYLSGLDNLGRINGANAAAMMFRRAVELAVKKLIPTAKPGDKLVKLIGDLPPDSVTPAMKEWAHHVRLDANEAAHGEEDFSDEDAEALRTFAEMFLTYAFTLPQALKRAKKEK